jgi:hypothetical protein
MACSDLIGARIVIIEKSGAFCFWAKVNGGRFHEDRQRQVGVAPPAAMHLPRKNSQGGICLRAEPVGRIRGPG